MSEVADAAAAPSARRLLREARERQGLHIAVLAASIKVTPKKLEALVQARGDPRPGHGDTDREVHGPRLLAQLIAKPLQGRFDLGGRPRRRFAERRLGSGENARVEERGLGIDVVEEEPGE